MTNTVPMKITTDGTFGSPCGSLAVQIGCEQGNYCLGHGYGDVGAGVSLAYPVLTPSARLRVKIGGLDAVRVDWIMAYTVGRSTSYYSFTQMRGEWANILSSVQDQTGLTGL